MNTTAAAAVLAAARHLDLRRVIQTSSSEVYGTAQFVPITEKHPLKGQSPYAATKIAADQLSYSFYASFGVPVVIVRPFNTYGPRMEISNDRKGFIGVFVRKALAGENIRIYGTGEQRRDFNYVDDVVEALLLAGERPGVDGQVYNLGHPQPESLQGFVRILAKFADFETETVPFPKDAAAIDIGDYYGDFSRFQAATGWQPRVGLEEGLAQTLAWYRAHPSAGVR